MRLIWGILQMFSGALATVVLESGPIGHASTRHLYLILGLPHLTFVATFLLLGFVILWVLVAIIWPVHDGTTFGNCTHHRIVIKYQSIHFFIWFPLSNKDVFLEIYANVVHLVVNGIIQWRGMPRLPAKATTFIRQGQFILLSLLFEINSEVINIWNDTIDLHLELIASFGIVTFQISSTFVSWRTFEGPSVCVLIFPSMRFLSDETFLNIWIIFGIQRIVLLVYSLILF